MYEYSFISVALTRRREGSALASDYRDIIRKQAASGWEFVQAIPFETDVKPRLDLVFRKQASS